MAQKPLPKTLEAELKYHDFATRLSVIIDYRTGALAANQLVRELGEKRIRESHKGDPCVKCGVAHDDVSVGKCIGSG